MDGRLQNIKTGTESPREEIQVVRASLGEIRDTAYRTNEYDIKMFFQSNEQRKFEEMGFSMC